MAPSMGKVLFAVGAALAACILVLAAVSYFGREEDKLAIDNILSENLTRSVALAEERGERLDLGRLAPFRWDTVVLAERGSDPEAITEELGFEWTGDVPIEIGDVLIFLDGGRVARYAEYRGDGAFADVERPFDRFSREQAVFDVRGLTVTPAR